MVIRVFVITCALAVCDLAWAKTAPSGFLLTQCRDFPVTKGDGEGVLQYCDNGTDQLIYLSGDLDVQRDLKSVNSVIQKMRVGTSGRFQVITKNAGGGDVEWHQKLMMAVEDRCQKDCRIKTEVRGACESACNQLHLTCARGSTTMIMPDGKLCEHASTGDRDTCSNCDPNPPKECNICGSAESIDEYTSRCGRLLIEKGKVRKVDVDPERKRMVEAHAKKLADMGVFDISKFSCHVPPWAETVKEVARDPTAPAVN